MSCKQPHYCVCRGEWPCVFDKPINHTTMTRKEEIREAALQVKGGLDVSKYDLGIDVYKAFDTLIKAILELTEPESAIKVDPSKVIIVPPVMIREGCSEPGTTSTIQ